MSMDLQCIVSMVIYTNANLCGHNIEFTSDHSTIRFAKFIPPPENTPPDIEYNDHKIIALNPFNWLGFLKKKGVTRLKIHYISSFNKLSDRIMIAFVEGGGKWIIEAVHDSMSDIYEKGSSKSATSSSRHLGNHFLLTHEDEQPINDKNITVDKAWENLKSILENLEDFAGRFERTHHWADNFRRSRDILEGTVPIDNDDIFPSSIIHEKNRLLLSTAFSSWVFGGIGSWNDQAFGGKDQDRYEALSDSLFNVIIEAIVVAINMY